MSAYVELIRNTPFLAQLFFIFFGLPALGIKMTAMTAAILGTLILIFTMYIPMIGIAMAGPNLSESEAMAAIGGVLVIVLIEVLVMVCLHSLLIFSFPLIVDKKMSAINAIKTSARAVWQNLSGVAGLFVVGFGVAFVGYLMLCIGIYLVLPVIIAANLVAYRKVFPAAGASI